MSFIDEHRGRYGVGPLCAQVPVAPSTYSAHKGCEAEPERAPARVRRDGWLSGEVGWVYDEHFQVYGVRKVWRQLRREGVVRCTVARLMGRMGLQGAVRGRRMKTTCARVQGERQDDRVNREFQVSRANTLWVSDPRFHHSGAGSTWPRGEDSPTRRWSSTPMRGVSPLPRGRAGGCRAHCTRTWPSMPSNRPCMSAVRPVKDSSITATGSVQSLSLRYTERLAQAGIAPSVGSVGDSPDKGTRGQALRQRPGRIHHRVVQDRTHRPARPVASLRGNRTRHPRMGALVQPPAPVRTPRACASGCIRGTLLPSTA